MSVRFGGEGWAQQANQNPASPAGMAIPVSNYSCSCLQAVGQSVQREQMGACSAMLEIADRMHPARQANRPRRCLAHCACTAGPFSLQGLEEDYAALAEQLDGSNVTVAKFQVGRWSWPLVRPLPLLSSGLSCGQRSGLCFKFSVLALPARRQGCALQGAGPIPLQPGLEPQGWHACWLRFCCVPIG